MPATSTTIHELKITRKGTDWVCRFETAFDDGRIKRNKLRVSDADMILYDGLPERPNPDYDPGPPPVGDETLPAVPPDPAALDSYITQAQTLAASQVSSQDAQEGISPDEDIAAKKEATIQQRAVAYLRAAYAEEQAFNAYLLFDRFNTFRTNQGWTLNQVQANLAAAGLTDEEWTAMRTAYQYLAGANRPAEMAAAKVIQENWEAK